MKPIQLFPLALLSICLAGFFAGDLYADPNKSSKYLNAVREFADNVLKYGRDTYGPKHTPLFVDGLMVRDPNDPNYGKDGVFKPVKWIAPNGDRWILSNLASQQNLFRTLDGLTRITGDPKYKQAAMDAIKYAFENLRSPNGLLYWGTAIAYDAQADKVYAAEGDLHALKLHYPYYELMWQVDPDATKTLIEAFWSAHILDWSNLDMNRIGSLVKPLEQPWKHKYEGGAVFFESKKDGHAFFTTGTSLVQAGTVLSWLSDQEEPLVWSKRLIQRYVDTRHPKTGIAAYEYNRSDPKRRVFPAYPYKTLDYPEDRQVHPWLSVLLVGEMLGEKGKEFTQWALEELTAWGKVSYREKDNSFVPMFIDGTNLEGHVLEDVPIGLNIAKPCPAAPQYFWAYCLAYSATSNEFMWQMVRDIALGNQFGDIGRSPSRIPELETDTTCSDVYGLLGFLELYSKTNKPEFLQIVQRIGDNILARQFHKGFFVPSKKHIYTRFDCFEPLALLHLAVAMKPISESIPRIWPSIPVFASPYRHREEGRDRMIIYTLIESTEPPLSLQEAAAIGDVNLVASLLRKGTEVDSVGDNLGRTAIQYAALRGYREVVELLIAKGARIETKDSFPGGTPLHYAAEKGHKEIVELLIAKGADVNVTRGYPAGDRPLHSAVRAGHKDIVELLIAKGAEINVKNDQGFTPLHHAVQRGHREVAEFLIAKGADINARNKAGRTPLNIAVTQNRKDIVELLMSKAALSSIHVAAQIGDLAKVKGHLEQGTDVNIRDNRGLTPLHCAVQGGHKEVVELLLAKGADANIQNSGGRTPLEYAVIRRHSELLNLIVKHELESTSPPAPRHDVSVTNISVASRCRKGNTVPVTISVTNHGTFREVARLTLRDQTDGAELGGKTVTVGEKWTGKAHDIPDLILKAGNSGADHMGNRVCIGGDANGDGYRDLLICAPLWYDEHGRAYLYYGGPQVDANADLVFEGQEAGCCLGNQSGTFADLNEDGCDDLIIGAPGRTLDNEHDGYVNIYYGGSNMDAVPDVVLRGEAGTKENFGMMVTTSDIDNDGQQDVLVGAQGYGGRGRVYLFWGGHPIDTTADVILDGEYFPDVNPSVVFNKNRQPPVPLTLFGRRIDASGDVNGDGYNDILVGARHAGGQRNNGCAYLFFGNSKKQMDGICDWKFRGEDQNYEMGSSVDISDIDADGYADLLVGARGAVGYHGRVYIYWGGRDFDGSRPGLILEARTPGAMGGDYIECGYFNKDRYSDIFVGAYGYPGTGYMYGRAYLFYGNAKTLMDADCDYIFGGECGTNNLFGCQVAAGDVNGDGYIDALIGEEGANQKSGRACLFYGPFHDTTYIILNWDTTSTSIGTHSLKVEIAPVEGEADTRDNVMMATTEIEAPYR